MGWLLFIAQPLVIGFAFALGIFNDGISVFNSDGVIEPPYGFGTAPKVPEFPGLIQGGGVPNYVVMYMGFVYMSTNDKSMIALCESLGQFAAQTVCFFRCDFSRTKGLPQMVGDYVIGTTGLAGLFDILLLGIEKFCICHATVTLP